MLISSLFVGGEKEGEEKKTTILCDRHGVMVTQNFSSSPGKEDFTAEKNHQLTSCNDGDGNSNARSALLTSIIHLPSRHQREKLQNYSSFRCADNQRVNNILQIASVFIKKQVTTQISYPGKFYIQNKRQMDHQTNIQEYRRYRDAQHHSPSKPPVVYCSYWSNMSKQNENEYSRYRTAQSTRERSMTRKEPRRRIHHQCRLLKYDGEAQRFQFPDDKVPWDVDFPDYKPTEYTTKKIQNNPKADSIDPSKVTKHNQIDGKIDRRSFTGHYYVDPETKRPRNPMGRTGMTGRGRLYYWGPNHAGDPVVTRWKRDANGAIVYQQMSPQDRAKPVLEFVSIQRRDTKQWAIPGGMVDPGESISETVKREFHEEAARDGLDEQIVTRLFSNGYKLYENYVDDPRNTDNAWMETIAMHFHDETGQLTKNIDLSAGDDADKVVWRSIDRTVELYACHKDFIRAAVNRLDAFW